MVNAVRDMAKELRDYKHHADEERDHMRVELNAAIDKKWQAMVDTVEAMRKDVYRVVINLQLNDSQHRDEHSAERKERAADAVDRLNRQLTINLWMGALTALVVLNLLLIGFVVVKTAEVPYGR